MTLHQTTFTAQDIQPQSITIKSGDSSRPRGQHLTIKTHLNLNKTNLNSHRPITAQDSKRRREKLGHMQISSTSRPITELLTNSVRKKRGKAAWRQTSKEFDTTSKEHQRTPYRTFSYYSHILYITQGTDATQNQSIYSTYGCYPV